MKKSHLTLKIFALIVLNDVIDTIAQLIMKKGLLQSGIDSVHGSNFVEFVARNASSPMVWAGVAIFTVNFFVWIVILYRVDLSIAMPVGSFCFILVPIVAILFLREHVSIFRWIGTAMIVLGVHLVSQSKAAVKEAPHG